MLSGKWLLLHNLNFTLEVNIRVIEVSMKVYNRCIDMDNTGKGTTRHTYNEENEVNQQSRVWSLQCKEDFAQIELESVNDQRKSSKIRS